MKRLILTGLSVLLASTHVSAASAQHVALNSATLNSSASTAVSSQLTPFSLVSLANQGYFQAQGIPSSSGLIVAYESERVSAEDLVKSAIATRRLSPEVLNDQSYLSAVNVQLSNLEPNR